MSSHIKTATKQWTATEIEFLQNNYQNIRVPDLAKLFGRSYYSVKKKMYRMRLVLSEEIKAKIFADCGKATASKLIFKGDKNPMWKGGVSKDFYRAKKIQMLRHPEKCKARDLLFRAIRSGKIQRGNCEVCGEPNAEGHHKDYSLPFDVIWLCKKHHMDLHKAESSKNNGKKNKGKSNGK